MGCGQSEQCEKNDKIPAVPVQPLQLQEDTTHKRWEGRLRQNQVQGKSDKFQGLRLLFIRHGEAEKKGNRSGRSLKDPKLSPIGEQQACAVASRLLREEADAGFDIVCSPMERCLRTAYPLVCAPNAGTKMLSGHRALCHALFCEHGNDPASFEASRIAGEFPHMFGDSSSHEIEFLGFGDDARFSNVARDKAGDEVGNRTISRAEHCADWLMSYVLDRQQCTSGSAATVIAVFCHQTFLDCLLHVLVDGRADGWEYGSPQYKFQNTGLTELRVAQKPEGRLSVTVHRQNDCTHWVRPGAYACD